MMAKKWLVLLMVFLVVSSVSVMAESSTEDECAGFFGFFRCLFGGENIAGEATAAEYFADFEELYGEDVMEGYLGLAGNIEGAVKLASAFKSDTSTATSYVATEATVDDVVAKYYENLEAGETGPEETDPAPTETGGGDTGSVDKEEETDEDDSSGPATGTLPDSTGGSSSSGSSTSGSGSTSSGSSKSSSSGTIDAAKGTLDIKEGETYKFGGQEIKGGTGEGELQPGKYVKGANGMYVPVGKEPGSSGTVLLSDGKVIPSYFGKGTSSSPGAVTSGSGSDPATSVMVQDSEGKFHIITEDTYAAYDNLCRTSCEIKGADTFETGNAEVTVRNGVIIQKYTSGNNKGQIEIGNDEGSVTLAGDAKNLLALSKGSEIEVNGESVSFTAKDGTTVQIKQNAWGLATETTREGKTTNTYYVGGKAVTTDDEGNIDFLGQKWASAKPTSKSLELRGFDNEKALASGNADGSRTLTVEDGDTKTTTTTYLDGTIEEKVEEDGKIESWVTRHPNGKLKSEVETKDGEFVANVFYDKHGNVDGICSDKGCKEATLKFRSNTEKCKGQYDSAGCYFDPENPDVPVTESEINNGAGKELQDKIYDQQLRNGDLGWQQTMQTLFNRPVSAYAIANEWEAYGDWINFWDEVFASYLPVTDEFYESAICEEWWFPIEPTSEVTLIETPDGGRRVAAHIEAEKTYQQVLLCGEDDFCPDELECRKDGFCYVEGDEEPSDGWFYKISWGVTAPSDDSLISASGSQGAEGTAVAFNIGISGSNEPEQFFFANAGGVRSVDTIELEKGESSTANYTSLIMDYSSKDFNEVCVRWSDDKRPMTAESGVFKGVETFPNPFVSSSGNKQTKPVSDLCNPINDAEIVTLGELGSIDISTGSISGTGNEVQFCGFSGC